MSGIGDERPLYTECGTTKKKVPRSRSSNSPPAEEIHRSFWRRRVSVTVVGASLEARTQRIPTQNDLDDSI